MHHDNARLSAAGKKREVMRLLFSFCPLRFCSLLSRCTRRDTDRVTLARLGTAVPRRTLTALAIPSLGKMPRSLQVPPGAPTIYRLVKMLFFAKIGILTSPFAWRFLRFDAKFVSNLCQNLCQDLPSSKYDVVQQPLIFSPKRRVFRRWCPA